MTPAPLAAAAGVRLGLGMAALGRPGYINLNRDSDLGGARTVEDMREAAFSVLDEAFDAGVRWFDCARSYGRSEEFVGEWLSSRDVKPDEVAVSSKWGYRYTAEWQVDTEDGAPHEVKDLSLPHFLKQKEETAGFLGTHLDLYQIHSATLGSGVFDDPTVLEALVQTRQERGWRLGLSVSSTEQPDAVRRAIEATAGGERVFDAVQCTYNLLEQSPHAALCEAHAAGMTVVIKEGMANGRVLTSPPPPALAKATVRLLETTGVEAGLDAVALGAVLAMPFEPFVLSGAVTPQQLRSNLRSLEVADQLRSPEAAGILDELMAESRLDPARYWADRAALAWN